jgi:hypothetical protein
VFLFSVQHLSEIFPISRGIHQDIPQMCIGVYVKYPLFLSSFNETLIFSIYFRKVLKYQIS